MARLMKDKTICGKCPNCCPGGGAIFRLEHDFETNATVKSCMNCGHKLPFRRVKPTGQPTSSQLRVLLQVKKAFGVEACKEISMVGRKVWFTMVNRDRSMFLGDSLFGTIGVGGAFEITLQRIGGDVKITDDIGIKVYLKKA